MFLLQNAEGFLNAFEVLRESNEQLMANLNSSLSEPEGFKAFGKIPSMGVDIVCLAFSVELYLKFLHYVSLGDIPRGHNILDLYQKLPDNLRVKLHNHPSIANYGWDLSEFEGELSSISDGFQEWRYSHEFTSVRYNSYCALAFIEAIKEVAQSEIASLSSKQNK